MDHLSTEWWRGRQQDGKLEIRIHNLRDWTADRHKTVDDRPFGGGEGMLLKPEPLFAAVETIFPERAHGTSERSAARGSAFRTRKKFDQPAARRLSEVGGAVVDLRALRGCG